MCRPRSHQNQTINLAKNLKQAEQPVYKHEQPSGTFGPGLGRTMLVSYQAKKTGNDCELKGGQKMAAGCVVQGLNSFELFGGTSVDIAALAFFPKKSSTVPCAYGLAAGKEPSSLELVPLRAFANGKGVKVGSESKVELKRRLEMNKIFTSGQNPIIRGLKCRDLNQSVEPRTRRPTSTLVAEISQSLSDEKRQKQEKDEADRSAREEVKRKDAAKREEQAKNKGVQDRDRALEAKRSKELVRKENERKKARAVAAANKDPEAKKKVAQDRERALETKRLKERARKEHEGN